MKTRVSLKLGVGLLALSIALCRMSFLHADGMPGIKAKDARFQEAYAFFETAYPADQAKREKITTLISRLGDNRLVQDGDVKVRAAAVVTRLLLQEGPCVIAPLIEATTNVDTAVRLNALRALRMALVKPGTRGAFHDYAWRVLPVLGSLAVDEMADVRLLAVIYIGQIGESLGSGNPREECVRYLRNALKDKAESVAVQASRSLILLGRGDLVPAELQRKVTGPHGEMEIE